MCTQLDVHMSNTSLSEWFIYNFWTNSFRVDKLYTIILYNILSIIKLNRVWICVHNLMYICPIHHFQNDLFITSGQTFRVILYTIILYNILSIIKLNRVWICVHNLMYICPIHHFQNDLFITSGQTFRVILYTIILYNILSIIKLNRVAEYVYTTWCTYVQYITFRMIYL